MFLRCNLHKRILISKCVHIAKSLMMSKFSNRLRTEYLETLWTKWKLVTDARSSNLRKYLPLCSCESTLLTAKASKCRASATPSRINKWQSGTYILTCAPLAALSASNASTAMLSNLPTILSKHRFPAMYSKNTSATWKCKNWFLKTKPRRSSTRSTKRSLSTATTLS